MLNVKILATVPVAPTGIFSKDYVTYCGSWLKTCSLLCRGRLTLVLRARPSASSLMMTLYPFVTFSRTFFS